MAALSIIKGIWSTAKAVMKHLPKLFKQGKKALGKLQKFEKKLDKIPGVKDNIETKPKLEEPKLEEVEKEIKKDEGETEESKESKDLSEEMNIRSMARAAHADLLRNLAGNIEAKKLDLAPEGDTEKLVAQFRGIEREPQSSVAALSNTGRILANQVQMGEAIQASNLAIAELAKTTADSDSADLLADRMNQMQEDIKKHMDAAQTANMDANADSQAKNKILMDGIASGMKNTMGFMKSLPDKMDKAAAFKDMLKDVVASYVEEASAIFNGVKMVLEKMPFFKYIKQGIGAVMGVLKKHVIPTIVKIGKAIMPVLKKIGAIVFKIIKTVAKVYFTIYKVIFKILWKIFPPILYIKAAIAIIKKLVKFFGKSKEEREKEKQAKKAEKEAKKKAKAEGKSSKQAEKTAKEEAQEKPDLEKSDTTDQIAKESTEIPDNESLAKEEGVDVGKIDTEGISDPKDIKEPTDEGAMDGAESEGESAEGGGEEGVEASEGELAEGEGSEDEAEEGDVEEADAEGSDAVATYNDNESQAEADQEAMLAQERATLAAATGGGASDTTQNVSIVQHTKEDPSNSYDDYMGG